MSYLYDKIQLYQIPDRRENVIQTCGNILNFLSY